MLDESNFAVAYIYPVETKNGHIPCTNCNKVYEGNFCPNCGEKRFSSHHLSIGHYAEETVEGLTHFDNKFFRTIKTLVAKPGQLSFDNINGKTVRFLKAFQLFLIINLIIFLLPVFNVFSLPLDNYVRYTPFTNYGTVEAVNKKVAAKKMSYKVYEAEFNEAMHSSSKGYIMVLIPFYALLCAIMFINKKKKVGEHLIFATHFMSFVLVALFLVTILIIGPLEYLVRTNKWNISTDAMAAYTLGTVFFIYLVSAFRKFYQASTVQVILATLVITLSFFPILQVYRMLMFYKIIGLS